MGLTSNSYQMGVPPGRLDILTTLTGLTFAEAWPNAVVAGALLRSR